MSIRFQVADKSRSTGFGKYADGSLKIACNFFSLRFFSHLLRASNEKTFKLQMSSFTNVRKKAQLETKLTVFPSWKQRLSIQNRKKNAMRCNYYVSKKTDRKKYTRKEREKESSHGIDIVRFKSRCHTIVYTEIHHQNVYLFKTMRTCKFVRRLNLSKVSIYRNRYKERQMHNRTECEYRVNEMVWCEWKGRSRSSGGKWA